MVLQFSQIWTYFDRALLTRLAADRLEHGGRVAADPGPVDLVVVHGQVAARPLAHLHVVVRHRAVFTFEFLIIHDVVST